MAQTTQIVPKYSFPYVETHVNDYTLVTGPNIESDKDIRISFAFAVASSKGIDNVWVRKTSKASAEQTFGKSNFKKYGQPLLQALDVLDNDNSQVWIMRVMPENAAYSNSVVSAYYKADEAGTVTDPSKRKFKIKFTSKAIKDATTKAALTKEANALDGDPVTVGSNKLYKDGEGFVQVPFMLVNYAGRGTCGDLFSLRINQAYAYEKEFGIAMYNFEVISSENSITKDANYVGALVSSPKYAGQTTTLINDILDDAETGVAPIDINVNEDNVEIIYDAYIEFAKETHKDLVTDYEKKLTEYRIPEDMLNGTAVVTPEHKDHLATIRELEKLIDDTEDSALPSLDEFDLICGLKLASTELLPFIEFVKPLDANVNTASASYDPAKYTTSEVVDFSSVKGLILKEGSNGYFDTPRKAVENGKEKDYTYEDELTECYLNAYNGTYDKKILSPRRFPISAFFDANYPFEVKQQIVELAEARNDCRVYLDANVIESLSQSNLKTLINTYSIFDNHMISVDIHNYLVREYSTNKKVNVTIDYFLSQEYVNHIVNYGYHIPFCKSYAQLSGHIRDSLKPVVEEYDLDIKETLNNNRLNYFECIDENVFQRAVQNTTQKANTDLIEESDSTILYNIKREVEKDVQGELYNFAEESVRNAFIEVEKAKFDDLAGNIVESFNIYFATSEYEFSRSILHCYVEIVFRGITKSAIVEIDINKRTYNSSNVTTSADAVSLES